MALITLAGRPRAEGMARARRPRNTAPASRTCRSSIPYGPTVVQPYAMVAMRHMHEFGTTSEQLAWIKVAASHHAQHNPNAMLRDVVTVDDVLDSPMISDPAAPARLLRRQRRRRRHRRGEARDRRGASSGRACSVLGRGRGAQAPDGREASTSPTPAPSWSGPRAFDEAGVKPADIKYASIYDSFTITVLITLEDLGFCEKGEGGKFVADGNLISGAGKLPFNTDGGGLCNNHPANRGGLTKVIEAVRQLRGEAHPAGAGEELRPGAGPRHRRLAGHPARQRHRHHGKGVRP